MKNIIKKYMSEFNRKYFFNSFVENAKKRKIDYRWVVTEIQDKNPPRLYEKDIVEVYYYEQCIFKNENPWRIMGKTKNGLYFFIDASCNYSGFSSEGNFIVYFSTNINTMLYYGITENIRQTLKFT